MRLTLRYRDGRIALAAAALSLAALPPVAEAARPAATAATSTASPLSVPPLAFTRRTLANGLEVLALPGGGSGSVSVQMWFRVGGKDDPAGRSGFAHLFEHLMFKGTKYMQAEQFDRLTEDVGGSNNAFTAEDTTAYHSVVPSNHLERLLWAEAERLAHLNVDEANFKSERKVVQEEFRQRVLADPYGLLFNAIPSNAYSMHPYRRPVIGSIADLDAATLDDVRAFHATHYRPDNAVLIVSGDFDPAQLNAWVDRYFGPLTHPDAPVPRVSEKEPLRTAPRTVEVQGPNVPLPAVLLIWQGPRSDHPDTAALEVAQALLAGGESSRLNQALVYRQRVAQAAGFQSDLHTDAGSIVAYAIAAGRTPPGALVAPLMHEIEALADRPISAAEMDKVKTQLLTAALSARQTALGLGQALGWAVISRHDPQAVNRELDELQAVTPADVQRVLRRYVLGHPAVTLHYTQAPAAAAPSLPAASDAGRAVPPPAARPAPIPPGTPEAK